MTRAGARKQAEEEAASQRAQSGGQASSSDASEFPTSNPISNPPERTRTILTERSFSQLIFSLGIREADAQLPTKDQTADIAPQGFVTVNRHMCSHGAIPPFNTFLAFFLRRLSIAPTQLHPNGHAVILGLCVLFMRTFNRFPSYEEVRFLCVISRSAGHPSIMNVRGARNCRLITDLPESASGFLKQYFYVRCPAGFYSIWREGGEIAYLLRLTSNF